MRTRLVVLATLALALGAAGCGTASRSDAVLKPSSASDVHRYASASPSVNHTDPRRVASRFFVAWGSYDTVHDGPDAFAARCRPLVTARLARELADDQPASAGWAAKRRRREVSVVRVAALRRPDGAPAPTARRVYLRVYADRVTTNVHGRRVSPTGVTLVLVHHNRRWLVDRVLFV